MAGFQFLDNNTAKTMNNESLIVFFFPYPEPFQPTSSRCRMLFVLYATVTGQSNNSCSVFTAISTKLTFLWFLPRRAVL